MKNILFFVLLSLGFCSSANAQCAGGSCGVGGVFQRPVFNGQIIGRVFQPQVRQYQPFVQPRTFVYSRPRVQYLPRVQYYASPIQYAPPVQYAPSVQYSQPEYYGAPVQYYNGPVCYGCQ